MTRTKVNTGAIGTVPARLPVWQRVKGWSVKPSRIAYHAGETAEDAASFAAAILASWEAHHATWAARVARKPVRPEGDIGRAPGGGPSPRPPHLRRGLLDRRRRRPRRAPGSACQRRWPTRARR